ncbi:uncharacterized protein LOC122060226 [Macadamia integrifolia]|uniref:uncharacterized protein LOC122060226 n=1 Tax=Macadamia integrifolia TaxID=60698 RepID=UPI001C530FB1|nr:uncharacterized protein LOC122060226 [Macadamia integrifolia]
MAFGVQYLDLILVPGGLLIMFTYHLYLIYRVRTNPKATTIGYENLNKKSWVKCMMEGDSSHLSLALSVISTNTTSAICLATICLTLSSLIGALVGSSSSNLFRNVFILGDSSAATDSLKYITMLLSFILAFLTFIQAARCFVQADFFISTPNTDLPVSLVQAAVIRGNNFWQVGLRLLYFAMVFLFWSFGPIPMFAACVIMVVVLSYLDSNSMPLHHYRPVIKPAPAKKVVDNVAAAVREAERSGKLVVEEMASAFRARDHHGV